MKTAVNWLVDHLYLVIPNEERNFLEGMRKEALDKEKEQIENAHAHHRCIHDKTMECTIEAYKSAEKYYKQTYKQEETLEE